MTATTSCRRGCVPPTRPPPCRLPTRVARLLEETMSNQTETPLTESRETGTHGRSPLTWLVAAAAAALIAGVAVFGLLNRGGDTGVPSAGHVQTVTHLDAPAAGGNARCMPPTTR